MITNPQIDYKITSITNDNMIISLVLTLSSSDKIQTILYYFSDRPLTITNNQIKVNIFDIIENMRSREYTNYTITFSSEAQSELTHNNAEIYLISTERYSYPTVQKMTKIDYSQSNNISSLYFPPQLFLIVKKTYYLINITDKDTIINDITTDIRNKTEKVMMRWLDNFFTSAFLDWIRLKHIHCKPLMNDYKMLNLSNLSNELFAEQKDDEEYIMRLILQRQYYYWVYDDIIHFLQTTESITQEYIDCMSILSILRVLIQKYTNCLNSFINKYKIKYHDDKFDANLKYINRITF